MGVRATNVLPRVGYDLAKGVAANLKNYVTNRSTQFQNTINRDIVLVTMQDIRRAKVDLQNSAAIPGIVQYAQDQENDPTYDVVGEFTALIALIDAVIDSVTLTFPTDAGGFLLEKKFAPDGTYTFGTFTGPQLANLRTALDAIAAVVV